MLNILFSYLQVSAGQHVHLSGDLKSNVSVAAQQGVYFNQQQQQQQAQQQQAQQQQAQQQQAQQQQQQQQQHHHQQHQQRQLSTPALH